MPTQLARLSSSQEQTSEKHHGEKQDTSDRTTHPDSLDDLLMDDVEDDSDVHSVSSGQTRSSSYSTFRKESDIANSAEEQTIRKARGLFVGVMFLAAIVLGSGRFNR